MNTNQVLSCNSTGFHHIAYTEWGDPDHPEVLVCAHGLTRNARDFDFLAEKLAKHMRVVCFDFAGRGQSDWLLNKKDYDYPQYIMDATAVIARQNVESVNWLGTSMGGILGITMASLPESPIKRLIVNDVGPFVPKSALERIASYVGNQPCFNTETELEAFFKTNYASFGHLSESQWQHITRHSQRQLDSGQYTTHYDPDIVVPFKSKPIQDVDFWPVWDYISIPTLLLRGEQSDLLLEKTAIEMTQRGPMPTLHTIADTGHAPTLMSDDQIDLVSDWLLSEINA